MWTIQAAAQQPRPIDPTDHLIDTKEAQTTQQANVRGFTFEDDTIPDSWMADSPGTLRVSTRHYKHGRQSLQWDWNQNSTLTITKLPGLTMAGRNNTGGIRAWIYNEQPTDDVLTLRFGTPDTLPTGNAKYEFQFGLNFSGWRGLWVDLGRDLKAANNGPVTAMTITAPGDADSGTLFFDIVEFADRITGKRTADRQLSFVNDGVTSPWQWTYRWSQQLPVDPLPATVTSEERAGLIHITEQFEQWILGTEPNSTDTLMRTRLRALQQYIDRGIREFDDLHIVRDGDYITGMPLFSRNSPYGPKFSRHIFSRIILPLALDYRITGNRNSLRKLMDLLDHAHDQGWATGSGNGSMDHELLRSGNYMYAVFLLRKELQETGRLERELATMHWYTEMGEIYDTPSYPGTTADRVKSHEIFRLLYILTMEDGPAKLRTMRNYQRWLNNAFVIAPGWAGLFKPDGLGFHHRGIYAGAYCPPGYHAAAFLCWMLHDTPFALTKDSRQNIRHALLTQRTLSNLYDVPTAINGRMPFSGARTLEILPAYAYMAETGAPIDREMAAAFKRLWRTDLQVTVNQLIDKTAGNMTYYHTPGSLQQMQKIAALDIPAESSPSGNFAFNYGALSIHRRDDWMVSVKGWSQYVWDYEHNLVENIYSRYCSFGGMQIFSGGTPITESGSGYVEAGWDWRKWPGTTSKLVPMENLITPESGRYLSDETFVGGLSHKGQGIFAMRLHDTAQDTSFHADKSVFFFDNVMVCLGSDIRNDDNIHQTITTLFQGALPQSDTPIYIHNQKPVTGFPLEQSFESGRIWLHDAYGNGYVLPDAAGLTVTRSQQESRNETGEHTTTGNYATAWVDHGTTPVDAKYEYAVLVGASLQSTADFAEAPAYTVVQKNKGVHIVKYTPLQLRGYAVFDANSPLPAGPITKVNAPCMVMVEQTDDGMALSLCDPDLRLTDQKLTGSYDIRHDQIFESSRPGKVLVTLKGRWRIVDGGEAAYVVALTADMTLLEFTCRDGKTVFVNLEEIR